MPTVNVDIQTIEGNSVRVSVTGMVGKRQSSATVMRAEIPLDAAYIDTLLARRNIGDWPAEARKVFAVALARAVSTELSELPHAGMIAVDVP